MRLETTDFPPFLSVLLLSVASLSIKTSKIQAPARCRVDIACLRGSGFLNSVSAQWIGRYFNGNLLYGVVFVRGHLRMLA